MKKKITPVDELAKEPEGQLMTRKQALKRSGYMALSAATMMLLLNNNANGQPSTSPHSAPAAPTNKSNNNPEGIWDD